MSQPIAQNGFLLDTVVTVTLYDSGDSDVLAGAFALCADYEKIFSRTDPESELYRLNQGDGTPVEVSRELREVLAKAVYYAELTGGRYDVTISPVVDVWDFTAQPPRLPDGEHIRRELSRVGWENIEMGDDTVALHNGARVDLGSIAKGYIADRMADYLRENGVNSALINLGGNVVTVGSKPDGSPFRIGVQRPFEGRNETIGIISATDCSVVSSGVYERGFTLDGALYHHILDPETGYPADTGVAGVTVVSEDSVDGDAWSTCLFLFGIEAGLAMAEQAGIEALFIDFAGNQYFTPGFADRLEYRENR